jgi:hypothetical protein
MKIKIDNSLVFKNLSDAIGYKIALDLDYKAYRLFEQCEDAIYPNDNGMNASFDVKEKYVIDNYELVQFELNGNLYWTSFFEYTDLDLCSDTSSICVGFDGHYTNGCGLV